MKSLTKTLCCLVTALSLTACNKADDGGKVVGKRIVQEHYETRVGITLWGCDPYTYEKHVPTEYIITIERCDINGKDCDSKEVPVLQGFFEKVEYGDYLNLKK